MIELRRRRRRRRRRRSGSPRARARMQPDAGEHAEQALRCWIRMSYPCTSSCWLQGRAGIELGARDGAPCVAVHSPNTNARCATTVRSPIETMFTRTATLRGAPQSSRSARRSVSTAHEVALQRARSAPGRPRHRSRWSEPSSSRFCAQQVAVDERRDDAAAVDRDVLRLALRDGRDAELLAPACAKAAAPRSDRAQPSGLEVRRSRCGDRITHDGEGRGSRTAPARPLRRVRADRGGCCSIAMSASRSSRVAGRPGSRRGTATSQPAAPRCRRLAARRLRPALRLAALLGGGDRAADLVGSMPSHPARLRT